VVQWVFVEDRYSNDTALDIEVKKVVDYVKASWIVVFVDKDSMEEVVDVHFVLVRSLEYEFLKILSIY
jgi:hypothetical protein